MALHPSDPEWTPPVRADPTGFLTVPTASHAPSSLPHLQTMGPPHVPLSPTGLPLSRVSLCPHFSLAVPTWAQALTKVTWDLLGGLGFPDVLSAGSTRTRPPSNTSLWHTHHALHSPCLLALHTRGPNPRGGQEEPSRASVGQHVWYKAEQGVCQRLGPVLKPGGSPGEEEVLGASPAGGPAPTLTCTAGHPCAALQRLRHRPPAGGGQ